MTAAAAAPPEPSWDVRWSGYATFFTMGSVMLLVPSLVRQVEAAFGLDDARMGALYLAFNVAWVCGTVAAGILVRHLDRHLLLASGPGLAAAGLLVMALTGGVVPFAGGFLAMGLGLGIIDSGTNAVFMDLYRGREAGALNRLHLWVSVGAMAGPLAVGQAAGAMVEWRIVLLVAAVLVIPVGLAIGTRRLPDGRASAAGAGPGDGAGEVAGHRRPGIPAAVVVLGVALAAYIAMESGVTSWVVRFLDTASLELATFALALYWGGMAAARLLSSFIADRMGDVRFATTWGLVSALAVLASLAAPSPEVAAACFAVAGFAAGPVYPMIMAIGGSRHPGQTGLVASVLATAGILGSIVFPPLMGVMSNVAGLRVAMGGAGLAGIVAVLGIAAGSRLADRRRAASVTGPATA